MLMGRARTERSSQSCRSNEARRQVIASDPLGRGGRRCEVPQRAVAHHQKSRAAADPLGADAAPSVVSSIACQVAPATQIQKVAQHHGGRPVAIAASKGRNDPAFSTDSGGSNAGPKSVL
jgi:hypothetical protein